MNEESIFAEAIAIESAEERAAFLDSACGDNLELRQAVQKLLQLSDNAGSFLEHPVLEGQAAALVGIDLAILRGDGSTRDGECEADESSQQPDDAITLSYLEPATREDSLGRLGHYEVLNVVGKGAFGTVLRAFDTKLERIVAIKVLSQEMASKSPARKRFLREARTSAQIRHENVVSIHSVEEEPIPYLVMEYIPGRTLQKQLEERGPLDLPSVLRLGEQIADGLAAAHAQDLVHRDIKPGNILLEGDLEERIKITDFGLARTVDDASMTQSGVIAGTPMYMAPEQAHGHKLDQRADLFSLGSVLYQMISGRPPFRAPTTIAVLKRVTEDTPRPIQEIIPETPNWLCELIGHLHAKNPAERFSSAREVSELLARCAEDVQAGRIPEIPDPSRTADETLVSVAETRPRPREKLMQSPLAKIAAAVVMMLGLLGVTEATGVTKLATTVIRLTTGAGTLIIETDDPGVKVAVDGEEVTITGGGVEELTLRPGEYQVAALKDGEPVKQELVSITRNGRTVVRMSLEPAATIAETPNTRSATDWSGWPADAPAPAISPFDADQAKSYQEAWAKHFDVPVEYENHIGVKFHLIPAGEFMMGSSEEEIEALLAEAKEQDRPDWFLDKIPTEGPQHKVTLTTPFLMGAHQVTRGQFRRFVEATGYRTDAEEDGKGGYGRRDGRWVQAPEFLWNTNLAFEPEQTDDHPVVNVSWNDAVAFCKWLSKEAEGTYRLPTEAEWEFACRAGSPGRYSFGNDESKLAAYAWYGGHGGLGTKPVGQKAPNAFGLFDVHGNVWEWCSDGFALYNVAPVIDPVGTNRFHLRAARGAAFSTQPSAVRSARRSDGTPTTRFVVNGFRVVLDVEANDELQGERPASSSTEDRRSRGISNFRPAGNAVQPIAALVGPVSQLRDRITTARSRVEVVNKQLRVSEERLVAANKKLAAINERLANASSTDEELLLKTQLEQAQSKLSAEKSNLQLLQTQLIPSARAELESAQKEVKTAITLLDLELAAARQALQVAEQQHEIYQRLFEKGIQPQIAVVKHLSDLKAAEAKVDQIRTMRELYSDILRDNDEPRPNRPHSEVDDAIQESEVDDATQDNAATRPEPGDAIAPTRERIPVSSERFLKDNEAHIRGTGKVVAFVPREQQHSELSTILDTSELAVELWISGEDAPLVQRGAPVRLWFEGWPNVESDSSFWDKVMTIDPTADGEGKFRVLVEAGDSWPDRRYLRPGVRAIGWVLTGDRRNTKSGGNRISN